MGRQWPWCYLARMFRNLNGSLYLFLRLYNMRDMYKFSFEFEFPNFQGFLRQERTWDDL